MNSENKQTKLGMANTDMSTLPKSEALEKTSCNLRLLNQGLKHPDTNTSHIPAHNLNYTFGTDNNRKK